ncbi:MAG: hypothetical protein WC802_05150 [Patescibacteria group bacterium]|jgi:hypothetical protein
MLKKEDWGGLIILAVIIVVVAVFFFFAPSAGPVAYGPVEATGSALAVDSITDKEKLSEVHVNASLKVPGFIVFHEAIGQAPGPIVGQSEYLQAGDYHDLVIHLATPLQANDQFFGLIFKDDGNQAYDPGIDLPVMSNGISIKAHFITPL